MTPRIPELDAIVRELEREGDLASLDDANRKLALITQRYNATPQDSLGGLSPDQLHDLLHGNWRGGRGLEISENLSSDDVSSAPFVHDARMLLRLMLETGTVRETPAKYLPTALVRAMVPLMKLPAGDYSDIGLEVPPPSKEADVPWLEALRHTCMFAGLVTRRKGLHVSALGKALLDDARSGELYALLFRTLFREYDLRRFDRSGYDSLQGTVAYSIYKLRRMADNWESAKALADRAWLPSAKEESHVSPVYGDFSYIPFTTRVLRPLVQFGLFEERVVRGAERWNVSYEYRRAALYSRALGFELARSVMRDPFLM